MLKITAALPSTRQPLKSTCKNRENSYRPPPQKKVAALLLSPSLFFPPPGKQLLVLTLLPTNPATRSLIRLMYRVILTEACDCRLLPLRGTLVGNAVVIAQKPDLPYSFYGH